MTADSTRCNLGHGRIMRMAKRSVLIRKSVPHVVRGDGWMDEGLKEQGKEEVWPLD